MQSMLNICVQSIYLTNTECSYRATVDGGLREQERLVQPHDGRTNYSGVSRPSHSSSSYPGPSLSVTVTNDGQAHAPQLPPSEPQESNLHLSICQLAGTQPLLSNPDAVSVGLSLSPHQNYAASLDGLLSLADPSRTRNLSTAPASPDQYNWAEEDDTRIAQGSPPSRVNRRHPRIDGYFGQSSGVSFINSFNAPSHKRKGKWNRRSSYGSADNYSHDEDPLDRFDNDVLALPQRRHADRLVSSYFTYVHSLCPLVSEPSFRKNYENTWKSTQPDSMPPNSSWLVLLNLIFAMGCEFLDISSRQVAATASKFLSRARTIIFAQIIDVGDLETVQALLLMGQYLQNTMQLNRCWTVIGLAIRVAQGIGLHLNPSNWGISVIEKEMRKRIWWGCFVTDRTLSMMCGRPAVIRDEETIEIGLPLPVSDELLEQAAANDRDNFDLYQPCPTQFFNATIGLAGIIKCILAALYDVGSGPDDQDMGLRYGSRKLPLSKLSYVLDLDSKLLEWQSSLPLHLHPQSQNVSWQPQRQRNILLLRWAARRRHS